MKIRPRCSSIIQATPSSCHGPKYTTKQNEMKTYLWCTWIVWHEITETLNMVTQQFIVENWNEMINMWESWLKIVSLSSVAKMPFWPHRPSRAPSPLDSLITRPLGCCCSSVGDTIRRHYQCFCVQPLSQWSIVIVNGREDNDQRWPK